MTDDSTGAPDLPDGGTFDEPWQARAFALAVALTDERGLDWERFQSRLVEEVADAPDGDSEGPDDDYYRRWLAALERLLVEEALVAPGELGDRVAAFAAGDRTAHEFVEGNPHAHVDRLPEGHAEGSHHDHGESGPHDHGEGDCRGH